jgi:hypothetical protein
MTAAPPPTEPPIAGSPEDTIRRLWWIIPLCALLAIAGAAFVAWHGKIDRTGGDTSGRVVGELASLRTDRIALQARADGEARIRLLEAFRLASLLTDALGARYDGEGERVLASLPAVDQSVFSQAIAFNATIKEALDRPGEGARLAVQAAALDARAALERLAEGDGTPFVLAITPRFVPPRRGVAELTLTPRPAPVIPQDRVLRLDAPRPPGGDAAGTAMPRYAPDFVAASADDPPVQVEVMGLHFAFADGQRPQLTLGDWRGEAEVAPGRLRFTVPRTAFAAAGARTAWANATLSMQNGMRTLTFQLLFLVLPDRPGSVALDQKAREMTTESNTLASPEILARADGGETRTVRRCFDPPPGWRFDKQNRRVVIVERLGWMNDVSDDTLNGGSVEFAGDEAATQVCVIVTAKPVTASAGVRTATIGRFEATLVHDVPVDRVVQSGIRALDWREPVRLPIASGTIDQKLYVHLFDEVDIEIDGLASSRAPFLRMDVDKAHRTVLLTADPTVEP